jgi:hypothetical protein
VALLAIEEVLGGATATPPPIPARAGRRAELGLATPRSRPSRERGGGRSETTRSRRRHPRRRRRHSLLIALALGLALGIGALLGSGAFNAEDRYNAELVAAQQGGLEVYGLPEVQGHPGAVPTRERSGSIREFLGMASVF